MLIVERMQVQRMTVIDLSMSYVYGAIAFGCFLMLGRQIQRVFRNARDGWKSAQQALTRRTGDRDRGHQAMTIMIFVFLIVLLAGVPVFIALAGSSLIYTHFLAGIPDFVILHRMAGGIDSFPLLAVPFFILAGNLMNSAGITNRIYDFAVALCGWMRGGLAHVNIMGSVIFAGMSGTAIADAAGLGTIEIKAMKDHGYSHRVRGRRDGRLGDARPDHPAVAAVRDLRHDGQRLDRRAVSRRVHPGRGDDHLHDAVRHLLRATLQHGPRPGVQSGACSA